MSWIKEKLISFLIGYLREFLLDSVDIAIEIIKDGKIEEFLASVQKPEHRMLLKLLFDIIVQILTKLDTDYPNATQETHLH